MNGYIKEYTLDSTKEQYIKDSKFYQVSFSDAGGGTSAEKTDGIISKITITAK